ncbi:MAG: hypothetical protein H6732_01025 [Alphaproteobacteria bacterium]|nr:hypothetical protein [Alphaproteobacteria bacterium]
MILHRPGPVLALSLLVALGGQRAFAAPDPGLETALADVESAIDAVSERSRGVEQRVGAGGGASIDEADALVRYQQAVYAHLIGSSEQAAERLFVLVRSGALGSPALAGGGEWYLAESLRDIDYLEMSAEVYEKIRAAPGHPMREDAVRRLLQVYARDGEPERFDDVFQSEIVKGGVEATDVVLYEVGKAFRLKGDLRRAKSYFAQIQVDSSYYARARYQVGASLVQAADLASIQGAITLFEEVANLVPATPEDALVVDLSRLALGRLYTVRSEWDLAVAAYERVGDESAYLADKLREVAWVHIRAEHWAEALVAVEDFLERFPDHAYSTELKLVGGHLLFERGNTGAALASYEAVVEEFEPVRARFEEYARGASDDPELYLEEAQRLRASVAVVAEAEEGDDDGAAGDDAPVARVSSESDAGIPVFATNLLLADRQFVAALDVYDDLEAQGAKLDAADVIIGELDAALGDVDTANLTEAVRLDLVEIAADAQAARLALLGAELEWLGGLGLSSTAVRGFTDRGERALGEVVDIQAQAVPVRAAMVSTVGLEQEIAKLERTAVPALAEVGAEITTLAEEVMASRAQVGRDPERDPASVRLELLYDELDAVLTRIDRVRTDLPNLDAAAFAEVRDLFESEVSAVAAERAELQGELADTYAVASYLLGRSFERVAKVFSDSIMGADMGIVNVAWSQWVEAGQGRVATLEERNEVIGELERRYGLLEQKLEQ